MDSDFLAPQKLLPRPKVVPFYSVSSLAKSINWKPGDFPRGSAQGVLGTAWPSRGTTNTEHQSLGISGDRRGLEVESMTAGACLKFRYEELLTHKILILWAAMGLTKLPQLKILSSPGLSGN